MQKRLKKIQLGTEINVDIKNNIGMLDNIEGNSYQATREGYNVFDYIERILPNTYGLTMQVDRNTGYITTNGTPTKNYVSIMPSIDVTNLLENGEIYTLWQENYADKANGKIYLQIMAIPKDGGNILYYNSSTKKYNITVDKNKYNYKLVLQTGIIEEAETFNNYKNRYMLYKGTEDKEFELYGNSPSLDYPSEVEAVGDNINLFDKDTMPLRNGLWSGNNVVASNTYGWYVIIPIIGGEVYTISKKYNGNDFSYITLGYATTSEYPQSNTPTVDDFTFNNKSNSMTFQTSKEAKYLFVTLAAGSPTDITSEKQAQAIEELKVEKGTVATPYSQYGQGNIEIIHNNKNELILNDNNSQRDGLNFSIKDGVITISGTATSTYQGLYIPVKRTFNEDYVLSTNAVGSKTGLHIKAAYKLENGNLQYPDIVTRFVFPTNSYLEQLYVIVDSGSTIDATIKLQLEKGTEVSDFTVGKLNKYILPIQKPFHKIGKYTDGFVRLGNQWYEQHYIKEYIFTGTETYTKSTQYSNDNWLCAYLINESRVMDVKYAAPMYATRFKKIGLYSDILDENCIFSSTQFHVRVSTNYLTENTTEAYSNLLKQWYDEGNPLKVYYISDDPELVKCTEEQNSILNDLSNIQLYNGINYIYTNEELKPTLKFLYYDKYEKDDDVYVFDKDENLIAVFDKDDEDTIINPQVHDLQNTESTFSFSLPLNSTKWQQINNAENLYYTDNKMFSTNFDGCFTSDVNENNEDLVSIIAYERQKLLERMYVRAWNSEDGFENVDTFMCVILSKGNLELKNNGELVNSTHLKGTSGYVLDGLLYGTGWTTGVCDVEGEFDFETDQVDIFNNILKVQEIWGGILVIDSVNKIIEHRDETKFLPYDGFEVRYQKNMQSLEKIYNNKIITELCPLGEGGLNIKSINGGSEWITNYTYSSSRLQGIENNADITDPVQLKKWGERKLKDLCKPSKELNVKAILLNQIEGFEHEVIGLNDIVDVIDYQFIVGDIEQLRVVEYTHKIWDNSDAEIVLSDITLDSTDIFKKTVSATDTINNGTLTTNKVVDFFKNGQSLHQTLTQIGNTIEQNKSDLIKTDEEIQATITNVKTVVDDLNHTILSQQEIIENLEITIEGLKNQLTISGGNNLIRNSVGIFGNEYWEGSVIGYTDTDIQQNNVSKNAIYLQNGSIMQELLRLKNGFYNISFNYKKLLESAVCKVKINDNIEIDLDNTSWDSIDKQLEILDNYFRIEFISDSNNACYISDLILIVGKNKQTWTQNINETISETVSIGQGIRVDSDKTNTYTRIDSDGNRTFNKATNQAIMEATDKGINAENAIVRTQAEITGVLQQKVGDQVWGALL